MKKIFTICFLLAATLSYSQVKIGDNPNIPVKAASLLELESSNKGLVFPRVSLIALSNPAPLAADIITGTIVYNTNSALPGGKGVYVWSDTAWVRFVSSASASLAVKDTLLKPTVVSSFNTGNFVSFSVYVVGSYAYVADGFNGLRIINISNPSNPVLTGTYETPGVAGDIFVSGSYAYIADGSSLQIINISNPAAPTLAGSFITNGSCLSIFVKNSYAYVANGGEGLQIINISNPAAPTLAGAYNTSGDAFGVFISGNYAYIADNLDGLQIINISNPASPVFTGTYNTSNSARAVFVSGNYAYVADNYDGLHIINISNPSNPFLTASYQTPGRAQDIYVSNNYAYIADIYGALHVVDVSIPARPVLYGTYPAASDAYGVFVNENYAYLAVEYSGLKIFKLRSLENILTVSKDSVQIGALGTSPGTGIVMANSNGVLSKKVVTNGLIVADNSGNLSATTDYMSLSGDQEVSGIKTFSSNLIANGNVGIGTSAPSQKLDVNGTVNATAFTGNGSMLTNLVNTTAAQTVGGIKTLSSGIILPSTGGTPSLLNYYDEDTLAATIANIAGTINYAANYAIKALRVGNKVTLTFINDATSFTISNGSIDLKVATIPVQFRPSPGQYFTILVRNGGVDGVGLAFVRPEGDVLIKPSPAANSGNWNGSNNCGFYAFSVSYVVQ